MHTCKHTHMRLETVTERARRATGRNDQTLATLRATSPSKTRNRPNRHNVLQVPAPQAHRCATSRGRANTVRGKELPMMAHAHNPESGALKWRCTRNGKHTGKRANHTTSGSREGCYYVPPKTFPTLSCGARPQPTPHSPTIGASYRLGGGRPPLPSRPSKIACALPSHHPSYAGQLVARQPRLPLLGARSEKNNQDPCNQISMFECAQSANSERTILRLFGRSDVMAPVVRSAT